MKGKEQFSFEGKPVLLMQVECIGEISSASASLTYFIFILQYQLAEFYNAKDYHNLN